MVFRIPVELTFPGGGGPGVNIFHLRIGPGDLGTAMDEALDALEAFYTSIISITPAGTTATIGNSVTDVSTKEYENVGTARVITSGAGGAMAPPALALCIGWKTSLAAHRGRGRTFVGPLVSTAMDTDGTPRQTELNVVRNAAAALVTASTGPNDWAFGVWGREAEGIDGANVLRDFTASAVQDKFAVLRSRRD